LYQDKISNWHIFLVVLLLNLLVSWLFQKYIFTNDFYHTLYSDRLEGRRIDLTLELINRYRLWGYSFVPLILIVRFAALTLVFQLSFLFYDIEIPFTKLLRLIMTVSVITIIMTVVRFSVLSLSSIHLTDLKILYTLPYSLTDLINISNFTIPALITLSQINIFEIFWGIVIHRGLVYLSKKEVTSFDCALIVLCVWAFTFFSYYLFIMFLDKILGIY